MAILFLANQAPRNDVVEKFMNESATFYKLVRLFRI
jgi:hypothetical protein